MNSGKFHLIGRVGVEDSFKVLVDRKIRERRHDERRLAEHRTTKHHLQARNSCVSDPRSYRIARRQPVPAAPHFDWKTLFLLQAINKLRRAWLKPFHSAA